VPVKGHLGRDKDPEKGLLVELLLTNRGLICVHIGRLPHELAHALIEGLELASGSVDEITHRDARHRDADRSVALLEAVLRHRIRPLGVDEVRDEAVRVLRLVRKSHRGLRGLYMSTVLALRRLTHACSLAEMLSDVLVADGGLGADHLEVWARALCTAAGA